MNKSLVLATVIAAAALVACGKKEEAPVAAPAPAVVEAVKDAGTAAAVATDAAAAATTAASDATGAAQAATGAAAVAVDAAGDAAKAAVTEAAKAAEAPKK
ncbi:MAG: hypothetical protein KJ614_02530 [Gammaproteobacteria bacterium]|uniref:hypothetical protein n=1 Tax=Rhodoferax sp. TaxID=50421 RepID=UPI001839BF50|nr:hypothetical protein [Rhodoferax sp.]MBU3897798.1 hypothetical protein [Gammaproteobacteria bacterium]MBA3056524.1 hypothetical protein [Rhodoferax sp.]MBU3997255.1 hypothetical protein [Gammaproteobacteria bacterium]MBU4017873.1 hypothetical protein [Gammaproteobacteria bacterium]MBU4078672.1 hypothetical protein [Gammaproteobacteria bacterium]